MTDSAEAEARAQEVQAAQDEKIKEYRAARRQELKTAARLSLPTGIRIPIIAGLAGAAGLVLGVSHGSKTTGLRFRAENAHRLPTTPTGWYLYHKSKNYSMAFGAVKEGAKMGFKTSFLTGAFLWVEDAVDEYRGQKDFMSTLWASLALSGAFSRWNNFPTTTAVRTVKMSLAFGLVYGLLQDAAGAARGRRPGYVDFIMRAGRRKTTQEEAL